jgi:penicillin-insensitive murein endopeptidase
LRKLVLILLISVTTACSSTPKGNGKSKSEGSVKKGKLVNGRRFSRKKDNYKYFSFLSYILFNRAWVHSKVLDITLDAYKECEVKHPKRKFFIMECSNKKGGEMWPHRTHQNGTSIDFGSPLLKNKRPFTRDHSYGLRHYAMKFDTNGRLLRNKKIEIDFEIMAQHILALEVAARKRNMFVKKVLLKINLKDDLFKTKSGKLLKKSNIYFAKYLQPMIDNMHDDHYHIDFGFIKN